MFSEQISGSYEYQLRFNSSEMDSEEIPSTN